MHEPSNQHVKKKRYILRSPHLTQPSATGDRRRAGIVARHICSTDFNVKANVQIDEIRGRQTGAAGGKCGGEHHQNKR